MENSLRNLFTQKGNLLKTDPESKKRNDFYKDVKKYSIFHKIDNFLQENITQLYYQSDINKLTVLQRDGSFRILNLTTGFFEYTFESLWNDVSSTIMNKDCTKLFIATFYGSIIIWDIDNSKCLMESDILPGIPKLLCLDENNNKLFIADTDNNIKILEIISGKCTEVLKGHKNDINCMFFSEDKNLLFTGSSDKTVRIWDIVSGKCVKVLTDDKNDVNSICLDKDNNLLFTISSDETLSIWDIASCKCSKVLKGHEDDITSICISKDKNLLFTGSSDQTVRVWDIASGKCINIIKDLLYGEINFICNYDSDNILIAGSDDIFLVDINITKEQIEDHEHYEKYNSSLSFITSICPLTDESRILLGDYSGNIKLFDIIENKYLFNFHAHKDQIYRISVSKNNKFFISKAHSYKELVKVWDMNTLDVLFTLKIDDLGKSFLSIENAKEFISLTPEDLDEQTREDLDSGYLEEVYFSDDNSKIITKFNFQRGVLIKIWEIETKDCLSTYLLKWFNSATLNSDLSKLIGSLSVSFKGDKEWTARIWDLKTKNFTTFYPEVYGGSDKVYLIENNSILLTVKKGVLIEKDNYNEDEIEIRAWNTQNFSCIKSFTDNSFEDSDDLKFCFTKNGEIILYDYRKMKIYDTLSGKLLWELKGNYDEIKSVVVTSNSEKIVVLFHGNSLKKFDIKTGAVIEQVKTTYNDVTSLSLSKDNSLLVAGSQDSSLNIWDLNTGKCFRTFPVTGSVIVAVSLSNDKTKLATASYYKGVKVWDINTGKILFSIPDEDMAKVKGSRGFFSVTLNKDGTKVLAGSDEEIYLWDVNSGYLDYIFEGHKDTITALYLTKDEKKLISGAYDELIKIWNMETGECIKTFKTEGGIIESLDLDNTETKIAMANSNVAKILDINTGECIQKFIGHKKVISTLKFTPDNSKIVTAGHDNTAKLWEVKTGKCLHTFYGHLDAIRALTISNDGSILITGSMDNTIKFWDIETGKHLVTLYNINDGFLWGSIPDDVALSGWFWTDRADLITVLKSSDSSFKTLDFGKIDRESYINSYNDEKIITSLTKGLKNYNALYSERKSQFSIIENEIISKKLKLIDQ